MASSQVRIGRFGLSSTTLQPAYATVTSWVRDGDRVSCGGWIVGTDDSDAGSLGNWTSAVLLRDRLLSYNDNSDEPVVPVTWTHDESQHGFYRVLSAQVPWDLALSDEDLDEPRFAWSAELQFVGKWTSVVQEMVSRGALRTNAHSIVAGDVRAFHNIPNASSGYAPGITGLGVNTFTTADGTAIRRYDDGTPVAPEYWNTRKYWTLAEENYYDASCMVLREGAAAYTWATHSDDLAVVGRTWPEDASAATGWVIGNGLVRVYPNTSGSAGDWNFDWWDGAAWRTKEVQFGGTDVDLAAFPTAMRILKNTPDVVVVRCDIDSTAATSVDDALTLDLTVRRGSRIVECYLKLDGVATSKWQIRMTTNEGNTDITGGRRATSNDANGDRYLLLCPVAYTDVTTGDGIALNAAATTATFGVAMEIDGSSATDPWQAVDMLAEFYSVVGQRHWISRA